jgi:hypothetical protein
MNGGRQKWLNEQDKPFSTVKPSSSPMTYTAKSPNEALRGRLAEVMKISGKRNPNLVDVKSPDEYTGKIIAPPGMSETAQSAGHIPGAADVPWSSAVDKDGRFKPAEALLEIYLENAGIDPKKTDGLMLPYRGTLEPYVACAQIPSGNRHVQELRRQLDRARERGGRANRKIGAETEKEVQKKAPARAGAFAWAEQPALALLRLCHFHEKVHGAAGIAPLVVVPGNDFEEALLAL